MNRLVSALFCGFLIVASGCSAPGGGGSGNGDGGGNGGGSGDGGGDGGSGGGAGGDSVNGTWMFNTRLTAFDPGFEDLYGESVATSGDTVIVGTSFKNSLSGIADVFVLFGGEWRFLNRLSGGPARFPEQGFGFAVAVGNNLAFVGAPKFSIEGSFAIQTGAVYVYQNAGPQFTQIQLLTVNDADDFELFGSTLAFEANQSRLVVGAPGRDRNQGAAYVFVGNAGNFSQQARLAASDGINFEDFGAAIATQNQTIVVAAPNHNFGTGAVYVYERQTDWGEVQKILAPDGANTDKFGQAVALEGDVLAIAAPSKKRPGDDLLQAGAVYVYRGSAGSWTLQQTIVPADDFAGLFGLSLAIESSRLAVTAGGKQQVLFFEEQAGNWTAVDLLEPQRETFVLDSYGNALALEDGTLVIGARSDNAGGERAAGAAYVYTDDDNSAPDLPDGVRF